MVPQNGSLTRTVRDTSFFAVDDQGFVDIFDSATLRPSARIRASQRALGAAIAPDGRTMLPPTSPALLGFWNVHPRRRLATPADMELACVVAHVQPRRRLARDGHQ